MDQAGRKSETTLCIIGLRQCFTLRARVKYVQTSVCSEVHHAGVIVDKHLVACAAAQGDGSRLPSENELAIARFHGRHVAEIAARLRSGRCSHPRPRLGSPTVESQGDSLFLKTR